MHIKRLLLPIKGQRVDEHALEFACSLVRHEHGCVCLLSVIEVPREYAVDAELPGAVAQSEALLRQGEAFVKSRKVKVEADLLQARDSGPAIVKEAQEARVDAVLLGLPYRRKQEGIASHSDTAYILEHSPCPVLIFREPMPAEGSWPSRETAGATPEGQR
ncbi:MAG: universal stress protein [Chloroflexota bacterium]|nr:universal stress protein [Chloroflexota bacterium]MDE2970024.1 universal stress protein [Chloroflexota bacterium]